MNIEALKLKHRTSIYLLDQIKKGQMQQCDYDNYMKNVFDTKEKEV